MKSRKFLLNSCILLVCSAISVCFVNATPPETINFNSADECLECTDSLQKKICTLLSELPPDSTGISTFSAYLDSLLREGPEEEYLTATDCAYDLLEDPESPFRNENLKITLIKHLLNSEFKTSASGLRAKFRLEAAMRNRPGSTVPDFKLETHDGKTTTFRKLQSKARTLVIFYDPDCDHCVETIRQLETIPISNEMTVMAIDCTGDKQRWTETLRTLPENWIKAFATNDLEGDGLFDFPKMPVIYIIDPNGKIILKEASLRDLGISLN